jgi:hypothetical protein
MSLATDAKILSKPFFDQGAESVFMAQCCEKVYVGVEPADLCATCKTKPESYKAASAEEAESVVRNLEAA